MTPPIPPEELDLDKLAELEESEEWDEIGPNCSRAAHADEALIAALRNAAPALIQAASELATLKAEIAASKPATPPPLDPDNQDLRDWNPGGFNPTGGVMP